ncbi:MAG: methylenetetrahydrofolate reductase [NAD(P)H] [Planctomycetes bacterium]|nr:methylenetetrahydrofolate reductase [NAD(P)H] [Planctomycetota bacterium]
MRIRELLSCGRPSISFEFFPPQNDSGFSQLRDTLAELRELSPTFVSVTYGQGGKTRRQTLELLAEIRRDYGTETMAHLTCAGTSRNGLQAILQWISDAGVENVLALRGDPAPGATRFEPVPDGFAHANELIGFARERFAFCLGGACYPEGHPESSDPESDLLHTRQKITDGCEFLITQLFFDNQKYFDFVARARALGIGVPIIPGIMPITNVGQIERFTNVCGCSIPEPLLTELRRRQDDHHAVLSLGVAHATAQCLELLQRGAPGIHFYTLNKSPAARTILMAIRTVYPPARTPASAPRVAAPSLR